LKTSPVNAAPGNTVRFVEDPTLSPYVPGQEYVALLRWEAGAARYRPVSPSFMFPIRDGRVIWTRADVPSLKDQMPAADFLSGLQAALYE